MDSYKYINIKRTWLYGKLKWTAINHFDKFLRHFSKFGALSCKFQQEKQLLNQNIKTLKEDGTQVLISY